MQNKMRSQECPCPILPLASRISSFETEIFTMGKNFQGAIDQLRPQAQERANTQLIHGSMLSEIINLLKRSNIDNTATTSFHPHTSEAANHPQTSPAGNSSGATDHG
jgi:hypothetical protein